MVYLLKYIGVINLIFIATVVIILVKKSKNIKLKRDNISSLGDDKNFGYIFNASLLSFSVFQVLFALQVSTVLFKPAWIFIAIGGLFLCIASFVTIGKCRQIHFLTSTLCFVFVITGILLLIYHLFPINPVLGAFTFIGTCLIPIGYLLRNKLTGVYWEMILFLGITMWNIFFTIPIL